MITLGQRETDNINQIISISELTTYKSDLGPEKHGKFDHINQFIKLSGIVICNV